ncbi:MAG: hypothetical protein IJ123_09690 [Blautia sp.]|nr:hypothetical protein [Blautia sp.]
MTRDINIIDAIQNEKNKDLGRKDIPPLDPEGVKLAEHCRFTFDIIATPVDPKR